jgi:NAD(P)-dependent dehydrogenase (short-subunit alcohol dehydrogenase family)
VSRIVWLSGAAGGLGQAIGQAFHEQGDQVIGLDCQAMEAPWGRVRVVDISSAQELEQLCPTLPSPEILVHCAGITADGVLWKMAADQWQKVLDVNLGGAFNLLRQASPRMKQAGRGTLLAISSINARRGKFGQSNYVASKAGLEALMRNAAIELGPHGIRANCIAPGMVETAMTNQLPAAVLERAKRERLLAAAPQPADIAAAVLFLCSPAARCITGQCLAVDSGQLLGQA